MSYGSSKWEDWVLDEEASLPIFKAAYDAGITTCVTSRWLAALLLTTETWKQMGHC